jgi:acyl-CoA reductase-like NAD-dependent aldehyde dehydrogenase
MHNLTMTIDGRAVPGDATFTVLNPATGEAVAAAPDCTSEQLDTAMNAAAKAFAGWRSDEAARREALTHAAKAVGGAVEELAPLLTAEQGKPLKDARLEVMGTSAWLSYFAGLELPAEVIQDDERAFAEVVRRPVGPVAAITPWNYPLLLAAWKLAPALRAGNTIVAKPSPYTPLSTLMLGEVLREAFPPGVLNVVSGRDPLGAAMTSHPVPRKISFTGSVATGRKVATAAADTLKRVTLELGGNDAAIVLDDADPAKIAGKVFWGAFTNNGQVCSAIKRLYVPEPLYDDMLEALAAQAAKVRVGNGADDGVQLGPLNNAAQLERVSELVDDALNTGGRVVAGGRRTGERGFFYEPTIVADVANGTRLVDEEQFGPALPVISYRTEEEALSHANATNFGLSGSVWSSDPERATQVAGRLECGTAWVNTHIALAPHQPFGGLKWSGIGVENGPWGLYGFTELQVIHRTKS